MTDRELLEQIATKVSDMDTRLKKVEVDLSEIRDDVKKIDHHVIMIENNHGEKLSALFDGNKQHTEQLTRIEKAVVEHDEILFKRVK